MTKQPFTIAVLGGTGAEGGGIALRLAQAGHRIILGSRSPDKAERVSAELRALRPGASISHADNRTAAQTADIVLLTDQGSVLELRPQFGIGIITAFVSSMAAVRTAGQYYKTPGRGDRCRRRR